jgi:hypothetical protein
MKVYIYIYIYNVCSKYWETAVINKIWNLTLQVPSIEKSDVFKNWSVGILFEIRSQEIFVANHKSTW